jgi:molecular chaperone Hsp33
MHTVTHEELLDSLLDAPELLYRLFHEEGVWVYDPQTFSLGCRCSRDRIIGILMSMGEHDRYGGGWRGGCALPVLQ